MWKKDFKTDPVLGLTYSWVMKIWVGSPSSFWVKVRVRCVRHRRLRRWGDRCIFWKLSWFEYRELWRSRQWCTNRWIFIFDWSNWDLDYFFHHVEHGLVEEVIQKPDAGLTGIFFEGNGVAVDYLYFLIIGIAWIVSRVPSSAPTTRLFLCLRLTLLKWSTIDSSTSGWTLAWVMGVWLIWNYFKL